MLKYKFNFPKYGEVEILSVWQKGKGKKAVRFLVNMPEKTNYNLPSLQMMWLKDHHFTGKEWAGNFVVDGDYKTPEHIKLRCYNYYLVSDNEETVREVFEQVAEEYRTKVTMLPATLSSYNRVPADQVNYTLIESM